MKPLTTTAADARASATAQPARRRGRWPIARLLAVVLAGLVLVTAAAVLAVTWGASLRNTFDFLNQRTVDLSADMERDIQAHLLPAEDFAHQTIAAINDGTVDPTDKPAFVQWLMGGLAAMPQARAIALVKPGYDGWSVHRADGPIKLQERSETPHALAVSYTHLRAHETG